MKVTETRRSPPEVLRTILVDNWDQSRLTPNLEDTTGSVDGRVVYGREGALETFPIIDIDVVSEDPVGGAQSGITATNPDGSGNTQVNVGQANIDCWGGDKSDVSNPTDYAWQIGYTVQEVISNFQFGTLQNGELEWHMLNPSSPEEIEDNEEQSDPKYRTRVTVTYSYVLTMDTASSPQEV